MVSDLETQGGAAIATSRLARALCNLGHRITRIVNKGDGEEHSWQTIQLSFAPYDRMARYVTPAPVFRMAARGSYRLKLANLLKRIRPEAINIHNLHGAASLGWTPALAETCSKYAPTFWTLHDMWSFTGRCAYSFECRRFLEGCDAECPTPHEYPALAEKLISPSWRMRQRILDSDIGLTAITPSRWLAQEAKTGLWAGRRVVSIPNGLPLDVYQPLPRALAREALGIRAQGVVLLIVAVRLGERRKGGDILAAAMPHITQRPLTILTLGMGALAIKGEGLNVHSLGYVDHEQTRVLAYNAADLLVHAAPVDNLPNVVMESIACGTPVVAFPVGGVPEMVKPGKTGWLANRVCSVSFAAAVGHALSDLKRLSGLRKACRIFAEGEWSDEKQAQQYFSLFNGKEMMDN